ncbi:hypothetical protein I3842_08G135200 [Carya illinoinensis]|uniref:F-box domain-containing protein n=1 Tax=Carya illinoinensis TaxID=32201 RepID=A0A922JDY1_CARIL|nr:hypothetical protein I3842_08G135200 [Carya illinoinensis]
MFSLNRERPLCYVRTGFSINAKFPPYLIYEILLLLPIKPLLRFQCLSNQYRALINSPFFITEHLESSKATDRGRALIALECDIVRPDCSSLYYPLPLRHREIQLVGYSNGLVTLHDSDYAIVIWNPLIRKYKQLPFEPIENPHGSNAHRLPSLAFGHDVVNDDYKVFRIVQFKERYVDGLASEVKVYSLRAQSLKRINDEWPTKFFSVISDSASLNGALHSFVGPFDIEHNRQVLIGFDLATEKFRDLGVLGDWLCVCQNVYATHSHFWVMKEYGIRRCKPLALSKIGEKVLVQPDDKKPFCFQNQAP